MDMIVGQRIVPILCFDLRMTGFDRLVSSRRMMLPALIPPLRPVSFCAMSTLMRLTVPTYALSNRFYHRAPVTRLNDHKTKRMERKRRYGANETARYSLALRDDHVRASFRNDKEIVKHVLRWINHSVTPRKW